MEYKNYGISVLGNGFFYCEEFEVKAETYAEITKLIDAEIRKSKNKFEKIPIYYDAWGSIKEGVITSFVGNKAWVTKNGGGREKIELDRLYEFSKENVGRVSEMQELKRQMGVLQNKKSEIEKAMTKFKKQN